MSNAAILDVPVTREPSDAQMAAHAEMLGGPILVGTLYRITYHQTQTTPVGETTAVAFAIVEYAGAGPDRSLPGLIAYRFLLRNPAVPRGAHGGTPEDPIVLWPSDVGAIAHAEPGDLELRLDYRDIGDRAGLDPAPR
jgi:hypothetical protein